MPYICTYSWVLAQMDNLVILKACSRCVCLAHYRGTPVGQSLRGT